MSAQASRKRKAPGGAPAPRFIVRVLLGTMSFDHEAKDEVGARLIFERSVVRAKTSQGKAISELRLVRQQGAKAAAATVLASWVPTPLPPAPRPDADGITRLPPVGTRLWGYASEADARRAAKAPTTGTILLPPSLTLEDLLGD